MVLQQPELVEEDHSCGPYSRGACAGYLKPGLCKEVQGIGGSLSSQNL